MIGAKSLEIAAGQSGYMMFGPLRTGRNVDGFFVSGSFSGLTDYRVAIRGFTEPPPSIADFDGGQALVGNGPLGEVLVMPPGVQTFIPLEAEVVQFSWIGLRFYDGAAATGVRVTGAIQLTEEVSERRDNIF